MLDLMQKGGPLMWLLLLCGIASLGVFLERLIYLHRASVDVRTLLGGIFVLLKKGNPEEAVRECATTPGPVPRVIKAALVARDAPRSELREIVEEAGQLEVPRLERNLGMLASVAYVAPLIGLLGTVAGLLQTFLAISQYGGYATAAEIASGVYQSLIVTGAGLAVAIPSYVAHSYLSARVNDFLHDMERAGIETIRALKNPS